MAVYVNGRRYSHQSPRPHQVEVADPDLHVLSFSDGMVYVQWPKMIDGESRIFHRIITPDDNGVSGLDLRVVAVLNRLRGIG
jgi:hypothetical protein